MNVTQLRRGTRVKIMCLGAISHCLRKLSPERGVKDSVKSQSAGIRPGGGRLVDVRDTGLHAGKEGIVGGT